MHAYGASPNARARRSSPSPQNNQCTRGDKAANLSTVLGYSGKAHGLFATLAELGRGSVANKAFAPLGYALNSIGAGATFTSSLQRGEPLDVAFIRASSPALSGFGGGVLGTALGALGGGAAGSVVPILGNGVGAVGGGIAGAIAGSIAGEKLGDANAEAYAKSRGFRGC